MDSFRSRIMLVCTIVLVMAIFCFIIFSWFFSNVESRARLTATGDIIAADVGAALAFGDHRSISKSLTALKADRSIKQIFILDDQDHVFAYYHQEGLKPAPVTLQLQLNSLKADIRKGLLTWSIKVERPIIRDGVRLGTVFLEQNERIPINKTIFTATIGMIFLVLLLGISFLLADRFQRETTGQISRLTETMLVVSKTKDFSIRVSARYNKEINELSECFNNMLSEIDQRDKTLLERQEQLNWLANYDALTGLPNRSLFMDRLDQALLHAARSGEQIAVLFIDLDDFKMINDTHGHRIGDLLLQMVSRRLADITRADDTLARLGGDEFTVFLHNLKSEKNALLVGHKQLENLLKPYDIEGNSMFISASIGVAIFPDHGSTSEILLKNADSAMYLAKEMGKNHIELFSNKLHQIASERLSLNNDLRKAMQQGELELYYQPRINLHDKSWTGAEALLRWKHPVLGMIPPDKFIPLAEETGLILPIGEWVIGEACRQLKEWHSTGVNIPKLSVNVSAIQLQRQNIVTLIHDTLILNSLFPANLEVEITESALMRDMEGSISILLELQRIGVKISLDDFGTGYSSLSNLRNLPIDILKIDRSFVLAIHESSEDSELLAAIISIAATLGIEVTAEGVECVEQERILEEYGCYEVQGYYYARPMPASDLEKLFVASGKTGAEKEQRIQS